MVGHFNKTMTEHEYKKWLKTPEGIAFLQRPIDIKVITKLDSIYLTHFKDRCGVIMAK